MIRLINQELSRSHPSLPPPPPLPPFFSLWNYSSDLILIQQLNREYKGTVGLLITWSYVLWLQWLNEEYERSNKEDPMRAPYNYGSHYSNSGTVLHFIVRLPPFTKIFLQYQGIRTTWKLVVWHSVTNVWIELDDFLGAHLFRKCICPSFPLMLKTSLLKILKTNVWFYNK